jgi:hypothetical protein
VVSTHPPLPPDEAVRVLRSSHSWSDIANRPIIDRDGPRFYILPYDLPIDVPGLMSAPPSRYGSTTPYGGPLGGWLPYTPFDGFAAGPRFPRHQHAHPLPNVPRMSPSLPPPPPPRSVVAPPGVGGGIVRRR